MQTKRSHHSKMKIQFQQTQKFSTNAKNEANVDFHQDLEILKNRKIKKDEDVYTYRKEDWGKKFRFEFMFHIYPFPKGLEIIQELEKFIFVSKDFKIVCFDTDKNYIRFNLFVMH